jgi:hypothetical protein
VAPPARRPAAADPPPAELLAAALRAVRPGGVVAYATCSPHLVETRVAVAETVRRGESTVEHVDARACLPGELRDSAMAPRYSCGRTGTAPTRCSSPCCAAPESCPRRCSAGCLVIASGQEGHPAEHAAVAGVASLRTLAR